MRPRRLNLLFLQVVLLLLCAIVPVVSAQTKPEKPEPQAQAANSYVGSDTCKGCHEELFTKFQPTPHKALLQTGAKDAKGADFHGCESCHGPGSAHVEGSGDKTKIVSYKTLSREQADERCLACHAEGKEHANFKRSPHAESDVGCLSCHSPHHAKSDRALLIEKQPGLCYQCHAEQKAEFSRPFKHRVNEGLVQCSDCHNVHGAFLPRQVRTSAEQDQVCFKCHTEKRGPFVYEHLPVKTEGCTSCHFPHGSSNPRMMRVSQVNLLCLQCHTLAMSNAPSQPPIGPAHNQNQKYQACTMCHEFVHGSNFSEVFFKP